MRPEARAYADECIAKAAAYMQAILDGALAAGRLEVLGVERFRRMSCDDRFDVDFDAARRFFGFVWRLRQSKGRQWAGQRLALMDWQCFLCFAVFGLVWRESRLRVTRLVYVQVARKNGKSTLAAAIGLYLLTDDREPGAEVYTAATKRDQAKIVWREMASMVKKSPGLSRSVEVVKSRNIMEHLNTSSICVPLGQDSDNLDGLNPHGAVVDELHAHKDRGIWDVLVTAFGARLQWLLFAITTAGVNMDGICYEQRGYAVGVLEGQHDDVEYAAFVFELDPGDRWDDPAVARKANPGLGVTVDPEELARAGQRAAITSSSLNNHLTKRLNCWVMSHVQLFDRARWAACMRGAEPEPGAVAFGGLDLSSKRDLSAFVVVCPPSDVRHEWRTVVRLYCPQAMIDEASQQKRAPYDAWARDGWLVATPGNWIDEDYILADIREVASRLSLREVGYDPFKSSHVLVELEREGITATKVRQGPLSLHAPLEQLELLVATQQIDVTANPCLAWMATNLTPRYDANGNMAIDRKNKTAKVDGMAALVMAVSRAMGAGWDQEAGTEPEVFSLGG